MGWTSTKKAAGMTMKDFVIGMVLGSESDRLVDCVVKGGEAYMAVKGKEDGKVFAVVVLIEKDHHYGDTAVKDMDEGMHPYYYNCPAKILDLLDEPYNEAAAKWRKACRETIANKPPRLKKGLTLKLANEVTFSNGVVADKITCVNPKKLLFTLAKDVNPERYAPMLYKLRRYLLEGAKAVA